MSGLPPKRREPGHLDWLLLFVALVFVLMTCSTGLETTLEWILLAYWGAFLVYGWHKNWKARDEWQTWRRRALKTAEKDPS